MTEVVEASIGHHSEACSAWHGGETSCTKSAAAKAAHGYTAAMEATSVKTTTTVETTPVAATTAVSASAAARGSIHWHGRHADGRNCGKSDQHFPEHGTLLSQV
ncbi:hypothetical protein [Bradyrhizobium sp. NFR13]|uniref:hypothetical protein n=1 Tax=Bradyrhizobium sp. NFR13 TaxID=1566285 RepID=UPI0011135D7F|nr:hypothetical protein [Bradyrhizobium sp. NFR13]